MTDKSGETSQEWREKYLDALDAQELSGRTFSRRQELLRRVLTRVSISADGQDDELDAALTSLRERLRSDPEDLQPLVAQIDAALLDFEQRRAQAGLQISQALTATLDPLQQLSLSRPLHKEIRDYLSQLPQRVQKVRLYPALLQQLAEIQRQALTQIQSSKVSTWQKWMGKGPATASAPSEPAFAIHDLEADSDRAMDNAARNKIIAHHNVVTPVPNTAMVDQISLLLTHLLEDIDVPETILPKVQEIQTRIAQGLTGESVVATLRAVRDLVMEAYLFANKAFAEYLNNVNQELADIYGVLGGAVHHQTSQAENARQLQDSVMQQMSHLESDTANATDLDQLKNRVQSQLGNIREALNRFQQSDQEQQQLSNQLRELANKIKTMEQDAEKTRTSLEKHRYKSLHDPLTDLPNREAYSERILYEFRRWQRYQPPLSLAICDLDYFKKINDNYGHQAGDRVLKVISRSIAKRLRQVDFFGRYGGEEFVVILPETNLENAHNLLEKIRAAIAGTSFSYKDEPLVITLSLGITEFRAGDTIETALTRADKALYAAKAQGRNRCEIN